MFSETRYALNGDLRVAYRASPEGERDIVFVPNWFTCCEHLPELPSLQGWVEAMTSLGRLIFFDQPGTGASDPVTPGALPTLEQWADSITAVLDDLGSDEAVLVASVDGALAPAALYAATHPSRTTALVALECYARYGALHAGDAVIVHAGDRGCSGCDSPQQSDAQVHGWPPGSFSNVILAGARPVGGRSILPHLPSSHSVEGDVRSSLVREPAQVRCRGALLGHRLLQTAHRALRATHSGSALGDD
jgi:pimeloyl-ACP methyl ester carboxylesterase